LKRDPRFMINHPFHSIHFQLPRRLLDALADESGSRRMADLNYAPGVGIDDPVFKHLAMALRPAFAHPVQASRLFVDAIAVAVAAHIMTTYGQLRDRDQHRSGGLAPWQTRRVSECIDARLDGNITIAELAAECGLSRSYFTQAFRKSMGITPHRWLMQRRVEKAKSLLREADKPAAEIALACGFASQSHLTRVFRAVEGCPPADWRRRNHVRRTV
jgi:AraC family transcriptional regulator